MAGLSQEERAAAFGGKEGALDYFRVIATHLAGVMSDPQSRGVLRQSVPEWSDGEIELSRIALDNPYLLRTLSAGLRESLQGEGLQNDLAVKISDASSDEQALLQVAEALYDLEVILVTPPNKEWDDEGIPVFYDPIDDDAAVMIPRSDWKFRGTRAKSGNFIQSVARGSCMTSITGILTGLGLLVSGAIFHDENYIEDDPRFRGLKPDPDWPEGVGYLLGVAGGAILAVSLQEFLDERDREKRSLGIGIGEALVGAFLGGTVASRGQPLDTLLGSGLRSMEPYPGSHSGASSFVCPERPPENLLASSVLN